MESKADHARSEAQCPYNVEHLQYMLIFGFDPLAFSTFLKNLTFVAAFVQLLGVYTPGRLAFLAHTEQKVSNIVGLTALRLAFFMGYE